jgi:hypothetical protein
MKRYEKKLTPCLINYSICHEDIVEWRYSSISLNLGTRWRWVVSFTPLPLYPQGKRPRYPLDSVLDLDTRWRWVVSFTPLPLYPQGKRPRYPLDSVLDLDTSWRWVVSSRPCRFTRGTHCVGGGVGPRARLDTYTAWNTTQSVAIPTEASTISDDYGTAKLWQLWSCS